MPTFEPLRPRSDDFASPFDDEQALSAFSPLTPQASPAVRQPMVSNSGEPVDPFGTLSGDVGALQQEDREDTAPDPAEGKNSFRAGALHNIGVNWAEQATDEDRPFKSRLSFYELDYDATGDRAAKVGKSKDYVEAANVFGRQFTRSELEKDDEGRKLLKLMEAQRTGAHQDAGFWKGFTDWNLGNTPWLGWMMDLGTTVSESISISKAMRKMQNGEAVTNHEALAVRRFMLQQELESHRSTGYQIGSTIRSSVPFVVEMAGATAMAAGAAKVAALAGTAIGGPVGTVVGGIIGAVGGFLFGGGRILSKLLSKGAKGAAKKAVTTAVDATMQKLATTTLETGFKHAERQFAVKFAADATGKSATEIAKIAAKAGRARAMENLGRELATKKLGEDAVKGWGAAQFTEYAAKNASKREIRKRAAFESTKWTAESFKDVASLSMDAKLARTFLVNGDVVHAVESGWTGTLEMAALAKEYGKEAPKAAKGFFEGVASYWKDRAAVKRGLSKMSDEEIAKLRKSYLEATMSKALGKPSAVTAVTGSISESLGGQAVSKGYAADVANYLLDNATKSFMLKYQGKGFVNGAQRLARWVGDGIMDGMLRWDQSIYHGAGTISRSGSVLGGKMAAFKEALKASFIEAPVRGTMQLAMQAPLWPVVSAAAGNSPTDFVLRGQLGIQSTALQTGDREMMDNARAIAFGSGLVEYISESSGRGFNLFAEGVAAPTLKNAPFLKATKEVGSYMARKLEAVFGTKAMMQNASKSKITNAVMSYLGKQSSELARRGERALDTMTRTQIEQIVSGAKGIGNISSVLQRLGLKSEKELVKKAMSSQMDMSLRKAGITYFVAHNMLEKGFTPQRMAQWLQQVGYDGVIGEMAEERYGGFFQGLLGLDESPSDSTFRDRWRAAMDGLFPDPHQLLVEAVSFSFPMMTQMTMNHLYSKLGAGIVQETLDHAKVLSHCQSTNPVLSMTVGSEENEKAYSEFMEGAQSLYDKATVGEGGEEKAWSDVLRTKRTGGVSKEELEKRATDRAELADAIAESEGPEVDADGNVTGTRKRAKPLDLSEEGSRTEVFNEIERIVGQAASADEAAAQARGFGASDGAVQWAREEWERRQAEKLPTRAQAVKAAVADGSLKLNEKNKDISNPDVSDGEMETLLREKAQRIIDLSDDEETLKKQLADHQAEEVFGKDGVEAIKRLWRKDVNHVDSAKKEALGKDSEYGRFVAAGPDITLRADADADTVASEITAALPFISSDAAMTAEVRERLSSRRAVQANQFSEDYVGEVSGSMGFLGKKWLEFKYKLGEHHWWGRRALMRVTGILDAITTGHLELAARNPVQWAMEEAQLPRQLMNEVGQLYERSIQDGRERYLRRMIGDGKMTAEDAASIRATSLGKVSDDLLEEFRKEGEADYRASLREYAQMFLTARNVIAVSKGDVTDAALRVLAHDRREEIGGKVKYRAGDELVDDFRSQKFRDSVTSKDLAEAKTKIMKGLAQIAASDAVAINTHSRFGNVNTTSITFSYDRAMRYGDNAEVVAAIRAMPAFRNMRAVYDVSNGGHVNDYALGRAVDVGELLNLRTDGQLDPADLRRVMFAMGRYYGEFTEAQNQQAAAQYLTRMRLAVENSEPISFEYRDGTAADVKTVYGTDKDGNRVVTLTANGVSVTASTVLEATKMLEDVPVPKPDGTYSEAGGKRGLLANWRQFAVLQNDSISSRDATSLLLLMHGTREKARAAYEAFYGVDATHRVDEALYPPQLRRVERDGRTDWQYWNDEEMSRALANELDPNNKETQRFVRGTGNENDPYAVGYERAAELMLERYGITRSKQDAAAADVYHGDSSYSIRPNGIAFGDTVYLQSDYYSGGDAEMLLRSALARSIFDAATKPGKAFDDPSAFVGILYEMDNAFTQAANDAIAELQGSQPDMAQRIKDAMDSLPSTPGRVDPARLAAIAAAVGLFSDERGMNEYGNGFLFGPELAYVADRARRSPWTLVFLSAIDEALGGGGFFADAPNRLAGLRKFADAFSPSGKDLMAARSSAMFTNGGEGARKDGIVFQWYGVPSDISEAGLAAGVRPVIDDSTLTNFQDVESAGVGWLLESVANKCKAFGDACRKAGGTMSTAEMYRTLKHALDSGGDTASDTEAPSIGSVAGGVSSESDPRVKKPLSSEIIPDDVAFGVGRNLQFLTPGMLRSPVGGVGGRTQALKAKKAAKRFLFERGCYPANTKRILNMFVNAAGAETTAEDDIDAMLDEEEWASMADVLAEGAGNQDIFFDAKRTNAALENRDLMDLGRQWSYVFPSEGGAFTQVLARMFSELPRISDVLKAQAARLLVEADAAKAAGDAKLEKSRRGAADKARAQARALSEMGKLFNVLRSARTGRAADRIAAATGVWNDSSSVPGEFKLTGTLLVKAVEALHDAGYDELAFVLNGVRNIPAKGKRRAQALALLGYMAPLDVNQVTVGDSGVGTLSGLGSAGLAAVSSVRAAVAHSLSRLFPEGASSARLYDNVSMLDNLLLLSGSKSWFDSHKAGTPFADKTIERYEELLAPAREGGETRAALLANPADDKALVAFANALAKRMRAVADAMDYALGPGNELTYALRSPDIVGGVVRSVRNARDERVRKDVVDTLVETFDACAQGQKSRCILISSAVLNPAIVAIQRAVAAKKGTPTFGAGQKQYKDITANDLTPAGLLSTLTDDLVSRLFARGNPLPQAKPRSKWFAESPKTAGSVDSLLNNVFGLYAASAPKSVVRLSGTREESIADSSQVTAAPASPPVMAAAVEDRLLAKVGVLDAYLQRGGRFEDGSKLVAVTAGAKLEDGTLVDKAHLSIVVADANISKFVSGDTRTGYFEIYHGEKPTVYSISLPHDVMQAILDGIHAGADWAMNRVTRKLVADGVLPKSIDDGTTAGTSADRGALYRALFSVVATAARCDQIDPKRTQVLLTQGIPFSAHRDRIRKQTPDGKVAEVDAAVTAMDGKTRVTPGLYCDIIVSGSDATENLGMYLNHGFLIESQRAQATNPKSVSFKNHVIDGLGSTMFKGQGHDFGLGMYETDAVPVSGVLAEACRVQRRRLEEILGIKEGTLDLPDPDAQQSEADKAYRETALKLVEQFFLSSTTFCTDMETAKTGAVSDKCGFAAESGKPFTVKAGGKELTFLYDKKGKTFEVTVDGAKRTLSGGKSVIPAFKNSSASVTTMLPLIAEVLGKSELTEEEVGDIEAEWTLPTGERTESKPLSASGLFQEYGTENGDKLSVVASKSGGYRVRYFTRSMTGYVMANSDASAKPSIEHPAATNWSRDVVANSGRVRMARPDQAPYTWAAVRALNVSRALPYMVLRAQPDILDAAVRNDPDLYAAWRAHPNSQDVQEQLVRRANSAYAKAMRAHVSSMHSVLMGSGIKASVERNGDGTYDVTYSYSAGVTDYDKDCFRDARVLSDQEKAAFGVGRSYSSGQVNVADQSFRYGWHLAENADLSAIRKAVDGSKWAEKKFQESISRFETAYGAADEDMRTVAYLAAYIQLFDRMRPGKAKEAAAKVLGAVFTDYTGKTLNENPACNLMKVSFSDLFLGKRFGGDGLFDLAAFEFRGDTHGKKLARDGKTRSIYLGGAFFAGDRRPSGNFEAAGGLIRVQAPVLFDRKSGRVDSHALYILPPLMNTTQGSDTDGDSATGTVMSGRGLSESDRKILEQVHEILAASLKDVNGKYDGDRALASSDAVTLIRERFPQLFDEETLDDGTKVVRLSDTFHRMVGNAMLQEEIDNYRLMPNKVQDDFGTRDVNEMAGDRTIIDYGLAGRSPVGPKAVSDEILVKPGGEAARLASGILDVPESELAGKSYYSVFQDCINRLSSHTMPKLDLLDPRVSAYLSGAAADANGARGVMVSLQAALEHLAGYADVDPRIRELAPALFAERDDGYLPIEDFIGHLDKISNALFDVVKDLFAPRAGWQKGLLNCLLARLIADANAAYEADRGARWDDEWFFTELVGFAKDLHASDTTLPSLIAKGNAFFDHAEKDKFLPDHERQTLLGAYNAMVLGKKGCVAKTAFDGVMLVKDGALDLTKKGKTKPVNGIYSLTKALAWFNKDLGENGEMVPARGEKVLSCITGLMGRIARALRMTSAGFVDEVSRLQALALGWRPASEILGAEVAEGIADVLEGKFDGRTAVTDKATKAAIGLRLLSATDLGKALEEAKRELESLRVLNEIMEMEDGVSPEPALIAGGSKAAGHLRKMQRAVEGGAAESEQMSTAYLASRLRLEDISEGRNPLASDRSVRNDMDALEIADSADSPASWAAYLAETGQRPMSATDANGNPVNDEALMFMAARSFAGEFVDVGTVQANRLNLSHVLGCVYSGVMKFGVREYSALIAGFKDASGKHVPGKYKSFAKSLAALIESALNKGTAVGMSSKVVDMLTMLRTDTRDILERDPATGEWVKVGEHNKVSLVLRASPDAAKTLQDGFKELAANDKPVVGSFTGAELAACIQLSMCANAEFDPARDSNVRANVSAMFGGAVDEWERWGSGVPQNPVLRQLCLVPRGYDGYNLFSGRTSDLDPDLARRVARMSGMKEVTEEDLTHPATVRLTSPFAVLWYAASTDYTSPHALYDASDPQDRSYLPGGEQRRRLESVYAEGSAHELRPQTSIPGVKFFVGYDSATTYSSDGKTFGGHNAKYVDTVEEAVNWRINEVLASYAADKRMTAWLADPRNLTRAFNQARVSTRFASDSDREFFGLTGRMPETSTSRKVPLNFDNVIDQVLERAWADFGEQFAEWAREAAMDGGDALSSLSSPLMREKLRRFVQAHAETALEAPSMSSAYDAGGPAFMVQRMKRGGMFDFLRDKHPEDADKFIHDPETNIRGALERVFGDWSKETGCKVERVVGDGGVPMNLLKITRKVKDSKGTREVVTYISYGDHLAVRANNAAYNQAILNGLNAGAGRKMTMEQLMALSEDERVALANAAGLRVKGESVKAEKYLGTKALMALTGLVRLSDVSDYHTLFHEYFHQMLDFYRKTGVCTAEDEAALLKKYRTADGRFDEESAADAFANYVTGDTARPLRAKRLGKGVGADPDAVFGKFHRTAQALLAGTMAYDARGVPVFMKMMISADFSERDMRDVQAFDAEQERKLEKLLLGEDVDFGSADRWERMEGELAQDGTDLARAAVGFRDGDRSFDELKAAARKFVEDSRKPENRTTFAAVMGHRLLSPEQDAAKPASKPATEPGPTLSQRIADPSIPLGDRVSLLLNEALSRVRTAISDHEKAPEVADAVSKFLDKSDVGEAEGPDFELMAFTSHRLLNHVCEMLGVNIWEYKDDGSKTLNALGRQLMSDSAVSGLLVRLVHEYSVRRMKEMNPDVPDEVQAMGGPAQFASADYVMGNVLAGVLPGQWTKFCRQRAEASRDWFVKAAEDLDARANAMRAKFPDGNVPADAEAAAKKLELQAMDARSRAQSVVRFVTAIMNGAPLKAMIPSFRGLQGRKGWTAAQEASNYYGYILQYITGAATMRRNADGSIRYEAGKPFGFENTTVDFSSRFMQEAIDAAAKALGVAQVVRRYVKENGVDQPAVGEDAVLPTVERSVPAPESAPAPEGAPAPEAAPEAAPEGAPAPEAAPEGTPAPETAPEGTPAPEAAPEPETTEVPPATPPPVGVMEPDLTPQLILQLPGSWQASDLQKQFYGGSFRDMMTDVSQNAAVEEANRIANRIDFYLAANCMPGECANQIEEAESELGLGEDDQEGLFTVEGKNRHSVKRVAGVRGVLLGLVNFAAKSAGRAMTVEDVNLVQFVSQAIACQANGHAVYTGYDIPRVNRELLDELLKDVGSVEDLEKATAEGGVYSPEAVFNRVHGHVTGAGRPSNLDQLLERMLIGVPHSVLGWDSKEKKFRKDGIYCRLLEAFYITGQNRTGGVNVGDADFWQRTCALLIEAGFADKSAATGRVVLTIPVEEVKKAWEAEDSYRTELIEKCGRRPELLDIDYLAEVVAAEANRLNRIAGRSRWLSDSATGQALSGRAQGLWFEAGTGHHQAIVDHLKNARELFRGEISPDEQLRNRFGAMQDTLTSHTRVVPHRYYYTDAEGKMQMKTEDVIQGNLPAFELGRDGQLANISSRQLEYLGRILGLGRRVADVNGFLKDILAGQYTKSHTSSIFGFDIRPDMTVFEFDRLIFDILSAHIVTEAQHPGDPGHTPLTAPYEGDGCGYGKQDLVDIYHLHGQLQQKLMDDSEADGMARGRICSMSERDMFRTQGKLGSSKSATERLRSMAESITHAERFRGCLAQMLTTVGTDGAPNFVVRPSESAKGLFPDEFWQATARFVLDRFSKVGEMLRYDSGKSGFENMQDVARQAALLIREKSKDDARARYHMLPPDELGASMMFDEVWCADDSANDDVNVLSKFTNGKLLHPNGSEAEGYMRQLFGIVKSPTVWAGHRVLDRAMSYSKAASVGLSAFFAFATRFESPVAACGFWNTAMGYRKGTAKLARRLAGTKVGDFLGFRKNMPYLADFLESITSDDPSIQYMRELCDMINMPLSDSVMNPLTSTQGAIDADIDRVTRWLLAEGHTKMAKELRSAMKAAFHNPGEYAFSNVLNGVKMAVVAQTMYRLREECEKAGRPFDPIRELRRHSAYINAEIGGIQPERYAWLTPGMQQLLRLGMFSYQWTLGAWVAGSGEVVSDLLFGGHNTTAASRKLAFVRWLRMLGIVKVGVPVFMQLAIKALATALVKTGAVGKPDDPDDKDPLGVDDMPWLCFFNESKVGSLAFDVTPITKLFGRSQALVDIKNKRGAYPFITTVAGTALGALVTRRWWGALAGGFAGRNVGAIIPASEGVGRGANTTGRRRQYMHFGKQNDEFWRWFTDGWTQATSKMSIPLQKVVEGFFGSTNGQDFGKKFSEKSLTDRFFTTSLDPNESATWNLVTGFMPFSAASVAAHPDTGVLGMMGPVNQGTSKTRSQKEVKKLLLEFVRDDRHNDAWSFPANRKRLRQLCTVALREARMNGIDPDELLTSALGQVTSSEYIRLCEALPKTVKDTVDARRAKSALRALYRLNRKREDILQSIKKKYNAAGVDWQQQKNAPIRAAVKEFLGKTRKDPWLGDEETEELFRQHFGDESQRTLRSTDVQQDRKGGEAFLNFLATDEVPETLFGIPVVSSGYTPDDLEFFKRNPKAAGYYDLGDGGEEPPPEEPPPGGLPVQAASKAGDTWTWETYRWNPEAPGGQEVDPKNIKGTGKAFNEADRAVLPADQREAFEAWMDELADPKSEWTTDDGKKVKVSSRLVPKDWRTDKKYDRDYDYVRAFLLAKRDPELKQYMLGPVYHADEGKYWLHINDVGKLPNHPTFSKGSYYAQDPKYADLAGDWEGETYLPGKAERAVHQDNNGGKAKKKIPPIVKGPLHYGPPPPPPRGPYPGIANNPGNVEKHERRSDKTLFKGEIGDGVRPKRFANFSDPVDGLTAAATVLSRRAAGLAAKGLPFTIENYVPGYAPKSENDVEGYINNLSKYSGFARDAVLDTGNAEDMAKLLKNVVRFESGVPNSEWFTDDEYRRAARAMNRSPESAPSLPATPNMSAPGGSTQTSEETRHGQ